MRRPTKKMPPYRRWQIIGFQKIGHRGPSNVLFHENDARPPHLGDIVYVDNEGHIHVVDRQKELIKVNGLQVAPAELEDLLLSHEDIQDCAVVGVPDPVAGELPRAFVVPRAGSTLSESDVQQFVKAKAVYYNQLKGGVEFVDAIPKSPSGKILRRLLRDRLKKKGGGGLSKL